MSGTLKKRRTKTNNKLDKSLCNLDDDDRVGTGLRVTGVVGSNVSQTYSIRQLTGAVSFRLLQNRVASLPMLMLFGDYHLYSDEEKVGLCHLSYCDQFSDCVATGQPNCCCFSLGNRNFYELLVNAYGSPEHPVDIFTEEWSHDKRVIPVTDYLGSMIWPAGKCAQSLSSRSRVDCKSTWSDKVRAQSADIRVSYDSTYERRLASMTPNSPFTRSLVNEAYKDDATGWHIDIESMTSFVMDRISIFQHGSLLMKQIRKQRLYTSETTARPLTDVSVWTKLFEMSLQNYLVMHDFESKAENRHNYDLLLLIMNCVIVDLYFLARLFKQPCLDSSAKPIAGCKSVWPSLCLLYLGDNHIRNIALLLTEEGSPVLFYNTKSRIDNFRGIEHVNEFGIDPAVGDPFRCLNFQELDLSINLDRMMRDWHANFAISKLIESRQEVSRTAAFGRRKSKKSVRKSKKSVRKSKKSVRKSKKSVRKSKKTVVKKI